MHSPPSLVVYRSSCAAKPQFELPDSAKGEDGGVSEQRLHDSLKTVLFLAAVEVHQKMGEI